MSEEPVRPTSRREIRQKQAEATQKAPAKAKAKATGKATQKAPAKATGKRAAETPPRRPMVLARTGLIAFLLSAIGVAGVGLLVLQAFSPTPKSTLESVGTLAGSEDRVQQATEATSKASAPTTAPTSLPVTGVSGSPASMGTVKGVYTLRGPASSDKGAWAMFVLSGPKRVVRSDSSAPFAVPLDTTKIPNGNYTMTVVVMRAGADTKASTRMLTVLNAKNAKVSAGATPSVLPTAGSTPTAGTDAGSTVAAQVVTLTNAERAKNGCDPLTVDAELTTAAQAHSADMAAKDYFDHNSQDGKTPFDRMKAAGYDYRMAAENIAMGQRGPQDVVTAWMNSAGHKANIMNCGLTEIGVGYALNSSGTPYWTQDFGTPA